MGNWSFKAFVNKSGHGFQVWYDELPIKAKAKFDRRLVYLQIQSIEAWKPPLVRKLKGYNKIFEHRVDFNKELFRPLGFFGSKGQEFIFLNRSKRTRRHIDTKRCPRNCKIQNGIIHSVIINAA